MSGNVSGCDMSNDWECAKQRHFNTFAFSSNSIRKVTIFLEFWISKSSYFPYFFGSHWSVQMWHLVLGFGDFFKSESTSESACWFCFELGENIMIDNLRFWKFEKSSQSWGFFMKNRKFWNFPKFLPKKCTRGTWKIFWKFKKSECFFMINRKFWNFLKFLPKKCARTLKNERFWKFEKSFGSASLRRSPFI